jgi:hypothetical protein
LWYGEEMVKDEEEIKVILDVVKASPKVGFVGSCTEAIRMRTTMASCHLP